MKVTLPRGTARTAAVLLGVLTLVVAAYSIAPYTRVAAHSDRTVLAPVTGDTSNTPELVGLASPGRIEGRSDVVNIGAATDGLVRAVIW